MEDYMARLSTEVLQRIITLVIRGEEMMLMAEQNAASMALVNWEWNEAVHAVGWEALISKRLGKLVRCESENAMWLMRMLRRIAEPTLNATGARTHFKLTADDMKPYHDDAVRGVGRRYDLALVVEVAISKHGGIGPLRAHLIKCEVSAHAASVRAYQRHIPAHALHPVTCRFVGVCQDSQRGTRDWSIRLFTGEGGSGFAGCERAGGCEAT